MSELPNLEIARDYLDRSGNPPSAWMLKVAIEAIIRHLEEQSPPQPVPASAGEGSTFAPNGSVVIETPEGTQRIKTTSSTWSFPVNRDGIDMPSVQQVIWDWVSSRWLHGGAQEVEIGVTFTSKGRIQPSGLASQSTVEAASSVSGQPGTGARRESSSIAGRDEESRCLATWPDMWIGNREYRCRLRAGHAGKHQFPSPTPASSPEEEARG